MKKILIVSHAMEIGGAEKALLGLLETIDTTKYKVDLFLMRHQGELMKDIPHNINLLPEISEYADLAVPITTVLKKGHFRIAYGRYKGKKAAAKRVTELGLGKNDVGLEYSHKYTVKYMPTIQHLAQPLAVVMLPARAIPSSSTAVMSLPMQNGVVPVLVEARNRIQTTLVAMVA